MVGDAPPGKTGWVIATPLADSAVAARAAALVRTALATSGPTEQFLVRDGQRESHVLDPRTGRGTRSPCVASVIGLDAALVDALATTLPLLTPARGRALLRRFAATGSLRAPAPEAFPELARTAVPRGSECGTPAADDRGHR